MGKSTRTVEPMWTFFRVNHYGGRVYHHSDGRVAIEVFNHYYRPIGFDIKELDGTWTHAQMATACLSPLESVGTLQAL